MNAPLRKVAIALAALFAILLINANVVQVVEASSLTAKPGNSRVLIDGYRRQRGDIIAGGQALALSTATNDKLKYLRVYPGGQLFAPLTGYYSINLSDTSIEKAENPVLSGSDSRLAISFDRLSQLVSGRTPRGGNVTLTVDRTAQQVAAKALGNRRGAVVALDPRTGAVLALVTSPSYDPALLTTHDVAANERAYAKLVADPAQPLLDRATAQLYPPGSTFKMITTAAALATGRYNPATQVAAPDVLTLPDTAGVKLRNFNNESCQGPKITLMKALEISCNTAYAQLGLDLGANALRAQAQAFGFGQKLVGFPLPYAPSQFPDMLNRPQTAQSAIGQFDVRGTPLQMAMIAAAIANRGVLMKPHVVAEEQGPDLKLLSTTAAQQLGTPVNPTVAAELTTMMVDVVQNGTGTAAQIPGVTVAGKTGTAEDGAGPPDAWFAAFAPAAAPTVALAVLVEHGGGETKATGGSVAAPIAAQVLKTLLQERR